MQVQNKSKSKVELIVGNVQPTLCKSVKGKPDGTRKARKNLNLKLLPETTCQMPASEKGGVGNTS